MPSAGYPALRITLAGATIYREPIAALATLPGAYRLNAATGAGIVLANQQRDILRHVVWVFARAPGGAVTRQHFQLLCIERQFKLALTGSGLAGALLCFAYCC